MTAAHSETPTRELKKLVGAAKEGVARLRGRSKRLLTKRRETHDDRRIEIERLTITSSKPFEVVVATVEESIGRPDMSEFGKAASRCDHLRRVRRRREAERQSGGADAVHEAGHWRQLRKESGLARPKAVRFLIGNPLILKEMAKHVPEAASYAPITLLVDERSNGLHLGCDRMASFLAPYGNAVALAVARDLDGKIERLMRDAAG